MPISVRWMAALAAVVIALAQTPARGGEIGSQSGRCALSGTGAGPCAWTSTKCKRPAPPMLYSGSTQELNQSSAALNKYVGDLNVYMKCVSDEAQGDAKTAVDAVQAGTSKAQTDATAEFNRLKSQYEADRLRLQTKPR